MTCKAHIQGNKTEWEGFIHEEQMYHIQQEKYEQHYCQKKSQKNQKKLRKLSLLENDNLLKDSSKKKDIMTKEAEYFPRSKMNLKKIQNKPFNQFPAIKIIRLAENFLNYGTLIYKGIQPKTSDKYFKYLQEVNISVPIIKQLSVKNLIFSSKFQCGNLDYVIRTSSENYDLHMRVDTNTRGYRQWFYFSVKNRKPCKIIFNIYQFTKCLSLYQRGMRPYIFSKKEIKQKDNQWLQGGYNVRYRPIDSNQKSKRYYLSFQYEFKHQNDEVYFAACPPYSYTFLNQRIQKHKNLFKYDIQTQSLTQSLCGLNVPLLTISSSKRDNSQKKKYIIFIARTHPGETSSSWVIDGIIQSFVKKNQFNDTILQKYIIKIIPMVNCDGVYVGNYRTGILGLDYNRNFCSGKANIFPEITAIKKLVKDIKKNGDEIQAFIDIHGHSIQRNSFIFGPDRNQLNNSKFSNICSELYRRSRYFKQQSCKFMNEESKIQTARVYCQFKQKLFSLTIENSLGLYYFDKIVFPFLVQDWIKFGNQIIEALSLCLKNNQIKVQSKFCSHKQNITINKYSPRQSGVYFKLPKQFLKSNLNKSVKQNKKKQNSVSKKPDNSQSIKINAIFQKFKTEQSYHNLNQNIICVDNIISQNKIKQIENSQKDNLSQNLQRSINDSDSESENLPQYLINQLIDQIEQRQQSKISKKSDIKKNSLNITTEQYVRTYMPINKIIKRQAIMLKEYKQIPFLLVKKSPYNFNSLENKSLYHKHRSIVSDTKKHIKTQPISFETYINQYQQQRTIKKFSDDIKITQNNSNFNELKKKKFVLGEIFFK